MSDFLQVKCPNCGKEMKARTKLVGKRVKCSRTTCNVIFIVPLPEPDPATIPTPLPFPIPEPEPIAKSFATPMELPRPAPVRVVKAKPVPQPAEPDDGMPTIDQKVVLKYTIGASVGFLAFMLLLLLGLFWRAGQPTEEQAKAYEAFIRTGNELADLNEKINAEKNYQDEMRRESVLYEHIRYLKEVDEIQGRKKEKLKSRYDKETADLLRRQKSQMDSSYANLVVVGQSKEGEYYITTRRNGQTNTVRSQIERYNSGRPYSYGNAKSIEEPLFDERMIEAIPPQIGQERQKSNYK